MKALRVSVTDRCNFRCPYCMPREGFGEGFEFLDREEILTFEEIVRLVRVFAGLGVDKVRLTGGEPLLRRGLPGLVAELARVPELREVTLTTNGSLLAGLARPLREAGLARLTVSLDSLDPQRFQANGDTTVTLAQVLEGLEAARAPGSRAPSSTACCAGARTTRTSCPWRTSPAEQGYILRFIEFMDVGTRNGWRLDAVVPAAEVARTIAARWPMERFWKTAPNCVSQHWRYLDGAGELGLIASVTEPFCAGCDRARLSADGSLFTCLFASQGLDLKGFLRAGASDQDLAALLEARWKRRDDRYSEIRSAQTASLPRAEMFHLGG